MMRLFKLLSAALGLALIVSAGYAWDKAPSGPNPGAAEAKDPAVQENADFRAVQDELKKPAAEQNQALIDQKLASVVASPDKIAVNNWRTARTNTRGRFQRAIRYLFRGENF